MLIIVPNRFNVERIIAYAIKASWLLTLFLCFFYAICTVVSYHQEKYGKETCKKEVSSFSRLGAIPLEKIGQGPLSLQSSKRKTMLPDMSREIALLAKNIRPDRNAKEIDFLLSLRSSQVDQKIKNGQLVFLSCDSSSGGTAPVYRFSERKTPLWIRPSYLDRNKVLLEVGLFMPSQESEAFLEEKAQFVLQEEEGGQSNLFEKELWFASLAQAKLWGHDVMFAKFGGQKYSKWQNKMKVEIPGKSGSAFCFLEVGDYLVWSDGKWVPVESAEKALGKPLAQVKSLSVRDLELEVWNEDGFYPQSVKLELQSVFKNKALKSDHLPQNARMKTPRQVSCSFAKRRYVLKQGDWIVKTKRGWKVLKRSVDVEDYLHHILCGELCIFESLVREHGKLCMKGYWVDEMRTEAHPFSLPVTGDRSMKKTVDRDRKETSVKKTKGSVTTYLPFSSPQKSKELSDG